MKQQDIKTQMDTKKDILTNIISGKRRSKTEKEKKRYDSRIEKANKYLSELEKLYTLMKECNYERMIVNESYIEFLGQHRKLQSLFNGEYIKVYKCEDTAKILIILSPVKPIKLFQ